MYFHLMRGQPVFPSRMAFHLYELQISLHRALRLVDLAALASLGVDTGKYGSLDYARRHDEYGRTQQVAEAAHLLDFDGLIVPNARSACQNVVLFADHVLSESLSVVHRHGVVDWGAWQRRTGVG